MNLQECYEAMGGSYDEACSRLMNDAFIERFILKFPADPSMQELLGAVEANDIETSFRAAHTLKGVAANLAFTKLANSASDLTEQLRPCADPADQQLLDAVKADYKAVIEVLEAYQAAK